MVLAKQRSDLIWNRYNFPISMEGCVLYLPLWQEDTRLSPFLSYDQYHPSCTVTGATWGYQGRTFDAVDDLIDCGSSSILDDLAPVTYIAWMKPTSAGELSAGRLFHKRTVSGDTSGTAFQLTGTQIAFSVEYSTTPISQTTNTNIYSLDTWSQTACTWDGTLTAANIHIYVNAVEATYATTTNGVGDRVSDAAYNQIIGNTPAGARTFDGIIGEALIYNRVLTLAEIRQIYRATRWRYN